VHAVAVGEAVGEEQGGLARLAGLEDRELDLAGADCASSHGAEPNQTPRRGHVGSHAGRVTRRQAPRALGTKAAAPPWAAATWAMGTRPTPWPGWPEAREAAAR